MNPYRITVRALALLALALLAGCSSMGGVMPSERTFEAPMARVKPAFVSTFASMGMMISSIEVRSGREVLKARRGGNEVEVELEALSRTATRARVGARSGGLLYDDDAAARIMQQAEKRLGGA